MKDLVIMLATLTPMHKIIEDIKEFSQEAVLFPTEENIQRLEMACFMFMTKKATGDTIEGVLKMSKEMEHLHNLKKGFTTEQN